MGPSIKFRALMRPALAAAFVRVGLAVTAPVGLGPIAAFAQGVPTVDTQNIAQAIRQLQ